MTGRSEPSFLTKHSVVGGLIGGLLHAGAAVVLWNRWFDDLWAMLGTKPLNGAYVLLGMFLLGFVPVVFYVGENVVSPAAVVAALFLLAGVSSWLAGPELAPSAAPTPFALYILLWVGVVALAGAVGRVEYGRRQQTTG